MAVRCQNSTVATSNPDEVTSSASVATSSTEMSLTPTKMKVTTTEAVMTSSPNSPSNAVVTSTANTEVKHTSSESPSHQPIHTKEHEKIHPIDTQSNETDAHSNATRPTMGSPHEPDVDTSTDLQQGVDDNWIVSVIVVFALLGGMLVFVVVFIIKDRARIRKRNLGDKKRPGGDHGFVPLKEVKTDEEQAKLTKVEKRSSHYGNPEDAVPLLELHIAEDGRSVLNSHDDTQDTQVEPNGNATTTKRPLLDLYGDNAKKSQETLNSPRFI